MKSLTLKKPNRTLVDMTSGKLFSKILYFAIPLMLASVLQLLFNTADVIVIGNFAGTDSLAAVTSNTSLIHLVTHLAMGLCIGANVVVAKAIGAKDVTKSQNAVHTSFAFAIVGGFAFAILAFILSPTLLLLMDVDEGVLYKSLIYIRIYFLGIPFILLYNFGAAILRAKGDTKRPLIYLALSGVVNVGLNILFVTVFHMDVAGVAIATVVSQMVSAIAVIICLTKEKDYCRLVIKKIKFNRELIEITRIGLPAGLYNSFFSLANVLIQTGINGFGETVIAGSSVAVNLDGYIYVIMNSFCNSAITFTGQNMGAQKYKRVLKTLIYSLILAMGFGLVIISLLTIFPHFFARLYSTDEQVVVIAVERLMFMMPWYFLCGVAEVLVGTVRGMGFSFVSMIVSLFCVCVFRSIWVYTVFENYKTLITLYYAYPISWSLNAFFHIIAFVVIYNRLIKRKPKIIENNL